MTANPITKKFTDSFEDCVEFARLFHNTCADDADETNPEIIDNVALLDSTTEVVCEHTGPNCVDTGTREADTENCTYSRKLCVKCYCTGENSDGTMNCDGYDVRIDVKSNGLPRNCFYGFNELVEQNIGFSVIWNPTVSSLNKVDFSQSNTSDSYADLLCKQSSISNSRGNGFNYIDGSNDMDHAVGISLDGVLLFPNLDQISSGVYVDYWQPDAKDNSDISSYTPRQMDSCYGQVSDDGEYNYMSASDCITARIKDANGDYVDVSEDFISYGRICPGCEDNLNYIIGKVGGNDLDSSNSDNDVAPGSIIGLAKDGHVIYGPVKSYNSDSSVNLYGACEIDACNGIKDGDYYRYVATTFHPYLVGCFGPTDKPKASVRGQYCTKNQKVCEGALFGLSGSSETASIVMTFLLLLFGRHW